jgi:RNA polymerase sigma-70 factor (ECF subfamily)
MLDKAAPIEQRTAAATQPRVTDHLDAGGALAFERLMRRHNQRLYRLAFGLMGDASEAEDVLQESYVRAFQNLANLADEASVGAWLAAIVRHEAIDQLRARRARRRRLMLEADLPRAADGGSTAFERAESDVPMHQPDTSVSCNEARIVIEQAIAALPGPFRAVFVLREVEGMSVDETAVYLGIPAATVKTRDHRARLVLRKRLNRLLDGDGSDVLAFLRERCDRIVTRVLARLSL